MSRTYLYAILAGEYNRDLGRIGLPDGCIPVTTIPLGDLSAVVGEYRGPAVTDLPKAELLRYLAVHQKVIESTMAVGAVLPVRFGTVLTSRREVRATLTRFQDGLVTALTALGDAVEFEVAATWDIARVLAEIGHEPPIAALVATAAGKGPEELQAIRIKAGMLAKEALDRQRDAYSRLVVAYLASHARDVQRNALPTDEMVLNIAFHVDRAHADEFHATMRQLDESFHGELAFRCIGPLPPYSFATVEIRRPSASEIESARRLLELDTQASEADLRARYRRLAAACHPDHHRGDPAAAARFARLGEAHRTLAMYMDGRRMVDGVLDREHRYDLTQAAIMESLLLTIKRSEPQPLPSPETTDERIATAI